MRCCAGGVPAVIHLWRREQGLLLPRGNPREIAGVADLEGLRLVRRSEGTGTRVLLDRMLIDAGIEPDDVRGPDARSHLEVSLAIASGVADAGMGLRAGAEALDLDFLPITWERYELVTTVDALGGAAPLVEALRTPQPAGRIRQMGGYDLAEAGIITRLDG